MRRIIDLEVPVEIAYDFCRQVGELPRLLPAIVGVTPDEPNGRRYRVAVGDADQLFYFEEIRRNERLAWRHLEGSIESASIDFTALTPRLTQLDIEVVRRENEDDPVISAIEPAILQVAAQFAMLARILSEHARRGFKTTAA